MTISFRSQTNAAGATGSTCPVNLPAGTVSGDILFAMFQSTFSTGAGPVNTLSGWTPLVTQNANYPDIWFFYRVAGGSEPSTYNWAVSNGDGTSLSACIACYQGGASIDVAGASLTRASSTTNNVASITTTNAGVLLLLSAQRITAGKSLGTPSGFTQRVDVNPNAGCELAVYDKTNASTGATGTVTQTSGEAFGQGGVLVQLYVAADNGTIATTEASDVNASAGQVGNPSTGTIASTEANDTFSAWQNSVMISFGASPSYVDNGQDGVSSQSGGLTGTPVLASYTAFPTTAITDNSGNSPYVTLSQQGFYITTGALGGNSGFAWPGSVATPTQVIGSLSGVTLTIASVTGGGAVIVGQQIAVTGSTLAGPVEITANVSGSNTGPSVWTVTNPSTVTEPASTAMSLSRVGGLNYPGQYFVPTNRGPTNDAGIFSDAQQSTGTSQLVAVQAVDASAFAFRSVSIGPEPKFSVSAPPKIYVRVRGYTGTPVTVANNTLTTTGATLVADQTLVHTAGAAYQKFSMNGFDNITSFVMENTGQANGNIVGGSASNSPPYSFSYLELITLNPNIGVPAWTEANDVNASTGIVPIVGNIGSTEANDTNVSTGSLVDIGTIASTEANDANSAAGNLNIPGTAAWTEANDTNSASGTSLNQGTIASTEANDVNASAGALVDAGTIGTTEVNDVNASAGALVDAGTIASTEASDTNASTGALSDAGTIASTEASDTNAATATALNLGTIATTEANDTNAASVIVSDAGTIASTEASDTNAATGVLNNAGTIASTEASDVMSATASEATGGGIAVTETNDVNASAGALIDVGTIASTEQSDTNAMVGKASDDGTIVTTEANDTNTATGTIVNIGTIASTETNDVNSGAGTLINVATIAEIEANDVNSVSGTVAATGSIIEVEANDGGIFTGAATIPGTVAWTEESDVSHAHGVSDAVPLFVPNNPNVYFIQAR